MGKVILRLIVAAAIVIGIGWIILQVVNIPGNFNSLVKMNNDNYQEVTLQVINYSEELTQLTGYEVSEFANAVVSYKTTVDEVKQTFETTTVKNFVWDDHQSLKKQMKKVYKEEQQLKSYLSSIKIYLQSDSVVAETANNMFAMAKTKVNNVETIYKDFKNNISKFSTSDSSAE